MYGVVQSINTDASALHERLIIREGIWNDFIRVVFWIMKVVIRLDGGLGNQMFQYAFGIAKANRYKSELYLDTSIFDKVHTGITSRKYALDSFNIKAKFSCGYIYSNQLLHALFRRSSFVARVFKARFESVNDFEPSIFNDDFSLYFSGYWQSYKYFKGYESVIFSDFHPINELSAFSKELLCELSCDGSIMVHVRRGDYVSLASASSFHGVLSVDFYKKAIASCLLNIPNAHFYVFSDDIAWCQGAKIIDASNVTYVENDGQRDDWEDLWLMSFCRHHIIANSSFSWWSAWLADQRYGCVGRHVFAPKNWFIAKPVNFSDRFPLHWNVI